MTSDVVRFTEGLSETQRDALKVLLEKGIGLDERVAALREKADAAASHTEGLEAAHGAAAPAVDEARNAERSARIEQAKAFGQFDDLFKEAATADVVQPFHDIRELTAHAETDAAAARDLKAIHEELGVKVPESTAERLMATQRAVADAPPNTPTAPEQASSDLPPPVRPAEPENTIEDTGPLSDLDRTESSNDDIPAKKKPDLSLPDHVVLKYQRRGDRYVDPADPSSLVFEDRGNALRTSRDFTAEAVTTMVDVAESRGWTSVTVTGTPEFRRAAWLAAASRGIDAKGYEPTEAERGAVQRAASHHAARASEPSPAGASTPTQAPEPPNAQVIAFRTARHPEKRTAAASQHPNLANAFAQEAAMDKFASIHLEGKDQKSFMDHQRRIIEEQLARGATLPELKVHGTQERSSAPEHAAEREREY